MFMKVSMDVYLKMYMILPMRKNLHLDVNADVNEYVC